MTKTLLAGLGATALLFGCSQAGIRPTDPTGTAGASGAGNSGAGTTGSGGTSSGSAGTGGGIGFDASFDLGGNDVRVDGVCSSTMTAAEPVPLDLYVLMDASLSMNETTSAGTNKMGRRPEPR